MSEWSDFDKYLITKLDNMEEKFEKEISEVKEKISIVDRKVTGIRSKVAMVTTVIAALFTGITQYIAKKLDL